MAAGPPLSSALGLKRMKVLSFDQFEFDRPDSEEHLEIAVSLRGAFPHPDVQSFVASAVSVAASKALPEAHPFNEKYGYGLVRQYLHRYAGVVLPEPCSWPTHVLTNSDNEYHVVLCGPESFICYLWSTSA